MKLNETLRKKNDQFGPEDKLRKATKLPPLKKSGKEKQSFYRALEDDDEDLDLKSLRKRESVLDYYDDGEDDWEDGEPEDFDEDNDWEDDWDEEEGDQDDPEE